MNDTDDDLMEWSKGSFLERYSGIIVAVLAVLAWAFAITVICIGINAGAVL